MKKRLDPFLGTRLAPAVFIIAPLASTASVTWNAAGGGIWDTTSTNWNGDATAFTPTSALAGLLFTAGMIRQHRV